MSKSQSVQDAPSASEKQEYEYDADHPQPRPESPVPSTAHEFSHETSNDINGKAEEKYEDEYPDGGWRAWSVLFGAACITFCTYGFVNSFGVFQAYYQQTLLPDVSPSTISWIGSIQYGLLFIPALPTGRLVDLGYFRPFFAVASIGFIVSVFLVAECKTYWQLLLGQGIAVGLFAGALGGPTPAVLTHWFMKRRFAAFGLLASGSSVGGTVLPIATRQLIDQVGYPWTIRILGFILLVPVAVANLFLRTRLPPRNARGGLFNWAAFKRPEFTLYVIASDLIFLGLYVPLTYLDISAQNVGISPNFSFYLISIANIGGLVGRISAGLLADNWGAMNILIPLIGLGGVVTFAWPYAKSVGSLVIVALIYGAANGAFVSLLGGPASRMGGMEDIGRRIGMVITLAAAGAVSGSPIAGAIRTATGGFKDVGVYAGSTIICGCMVMGISRRVALGSWKGVY